MLKAEITSIFDNFAIKIPPFDIIIKGFGINGNFYLMSICGIKKSAVNTADFLT